MGTKNPGKIEGAKQAFEKYFDNVEIQGISVPSEVSDQPFNEEIIQGARNRVKNLKKYAIENNIEADFYISSEAGITNSLGVWIDINLAVVEDSEGLQTTPALIECKENFESYWSQKLCNVLRAINKLKYN